MDCKTINILSLFIPGLIAILGNIIFYMIIKGRIDKSIERHKISYAGIYKEKIEIHKEILKQLFGLKFIIQSYQYSGKQLTENFYDDVNKFINYYQANQPFLRQNIINRLNEITEELKECFNDFYMHHSLSKPYIDLELKKDKLEKFFESGNKFKKDGLFNQIERLLINEMKIDLKIDE